MIGAFLKTSFQCIISMVGSGAGAYTPLNLTSIMYLTLSKCWPSLYFFPSEKGICVALHRSKFFSMTFLSICRLTHYMELMMSSFTPADFSAVQKAGFEAMFDALGQGF